MTDFHPLPSIDLELTSKLQDPEYRESFFLAEASAEIARQLITLRKLRGYSQSELAERAGTQQPAVSRAEQADYQNWSFTTLRKLTNAMAGRLRVIIEPLEDVLAEYAPEEHKPILLTDDGQKKKEDARKSSSSASEEASFDPKSHEDQRFNRERKISALRPWPDRDRKPNEQGSSQWI